MENCLEQILDDVIRIDIYRQSNVTFSVPFNAPAVNEITCTINSSITPVLSINLTETNTSDVVMEPAPKIQTTEKRETTGLIRTHAIEATIKDGFQTAQSAVDSLIYNDCVALLTTYNGTKYVVNPFPNTSTVTLSDNRQETHTMTVKYQAQSFSGLITAAVSSSSSSD